MHKICSECEFYSVDLSMTECPECAANMRLTTLPPAGLKLTASDEPEPEPVEPVPSGEALELPLAVRLAQIGTGIFVFFAVSRWGTRILLLLIGSRTSVETSAQAAYLFVYTALLYVSASLAGGAVAGAWSVNWIPQGLGVGLGVLVFPLIILLIFAPESIPVYLIGVVVTTALTVLGAFVGHKLIRPSHFVA